MDLRTKINLILIRYDISKDELAEMEKKEISKVGDRLKDIMEISMKYIQEENKIRSGYVEKIVSALEEAR